MTTATAPAAPNHDTLTCYTSYRCRRPECVARYNAHALERLTAQKNGTWDALVDVEPVRRHILQLTAAGIGICSIATAAETWPQTLYDIIRPRPLRGTGRRHRVNSALAERLLAITPDNATPYRVDPTGTIRRIQALVAAGWPQTTIAEHAGLSREYLTSLFRRTTVYASTARAIAKTYAELSQQRPSRVGIDKLQSSKARRRAAAKRWPTPKYWNENPGLIDDPDFTPEYGIPRAEQIAKEAHWLIIAGGATPSFAAERLGVTSGYVTQALRDYPQEAAA